MIRRCPTCQRVNPTDATFCYFDGKPLGTGAGSNTSLVYGTVAFPRPFVFPNGVRCDNFAQLAQACVRHPEVTIEALRGGFLGTFFGGMGRVDLAMAAKSLAAMPDTDRALNDLLGKLPGSSLRPAQLLVEPAGKDLGIVQMGEDREFTLKMTNKGDRLLHGQALVGDCHWLMLGESGSPEKLLQFFDSTSLMVRIQGKRLHAFARPQKGEIRIESSGGNVVVPVELMVPVKPFPEGALAGATSPRQLATLAKAHIKEAAVLLEKGAVKRWYEANGWTYPVQGPTAHGIAAVQQLFEYLGLVKPPKVELSESSVSLRGHPGERVTHALRVTTQEKRAAFAHAVSDQKWLKVGKTAFNGQTATIPLLVEAVPLEPGQTLKAHAKVIANGNQRFDVGITLHVGDAVVAARSSRDEPEFAFSSPAYEEAPDTSPFANLTAPAAREERSRRAAAPEASPFAFADLTAPVEPPPPMPPPPPPPPGATPPGLPGSRHIGRMEPIGPEAKAPDELDFVEEDVPRLLSPLPQEHEEVGSPARRGLAPTGRRRRLLMRLLPVGVVVVGLLTAAIRDVFFREAADVPLPEIDYANPILDLHFHEKVAPGDFVPVPSMRFGLGIPDPTKPKTFKTKLIYDDMGRTCNVCVRIDKNIEFLLGIEQGAWKEPRKAPLGKDQDGHQIIGAKSVWQRNAPPNVVITQYVEIVPAGLSEDGKKRLLDTCLVRYDITNEDPAPHTVGLRFLLDTFIGTNDAVPFTIAGAKELCETMKSFDKPEDVPDFISALEKQNVTNPGTVAHLSLRYGDTLEPPERVTLGAWPAASLRKNPSGALANMQNTRWEVPVIPMFLARSAENPDGDSAVTMYWMDKELRPKQTRTVGFAYGLGSVTGDKGQGQLGITAGGELVADREFTLTAYVKNPAPGITVTLTLPRGLTLATGRDRESVPPVPPGAASPYSPVTWRIKAIKSGVQRVKVSLSTGAMTEHRLVIKPSGIFK
jgi:hypothetical protein